MHLSSSITLLIQMGKQSNLVGLAESLDSCVSDFTSDFCLAVAPLFFGCLRVVAVFDFCLQHAPGAVGEVRVPKSIFRAFAYLGRLIGIREQRVEVARRKTKFV